MKCPYCSNTKFMTKETKNNKNAIYYRRRRACLSCGRAFTTYEIPLEPCNYRELEKRLTKEGENND